METLAALSGGLGCNSRVAQRVSKTNVPFDTLLRARILDSLNVLIWQKTKDGAKGRRRPQSVAEALLGLAPQGDRVQGFNTVEEFKAAMARFGG